MEDTIAVATFYHFAKLENYEDMKYPILDFCKQNKIKGTVLLAEEGINSTIAGQAESLESFFEFLKSDKRLEDVTWKQSRCKFQPFQKLKVRLKKEVVRLADQNLEVMHDKNQSGQYIEPQDWDDFIAKKDVKVIDTRNFYETKLGRFENAVDPNTVNFSDFSDWVKRWIKQEKIEKDAKIAMYCTGGIRCEKSTAYMKNLGFKNVYHLKGGILNYFEKTQNKSNKWQGNCFVFDDRVAVDSNLQPVQLNCTICNKTVTTDDLQNVSKGKIVCLACSAAD